MPPPLAPRWRGGGSYEYRQPAGPLAEGCRSCAGGGVATSVAARGIDVNLTLPEYYDEFPVVTLDRYDMAD